MIAVGTRPGPAADGRVRRAHRARLRRDPPPDRCPTSLVVVGAGVIGIEYASMFAALGTKVTVVEQRERAARVLRLRGRRGAAVPPARPGRDVPVRRGRCVGVERHDGGTITHLQSGKRIPADTVMYSAGRQGATDELDLGAAGIEADDRGRIAVDEHYRTSVEHIYAVGDVIGFPSLAATSMEQGRLAAAHACGDRRRGRSPSCCRSASTPSPRSASSAGPRRS